MPIYVAGDSADVWANPDQFYLDEQMHPIEVAGCPPDAFSEDGQLWGNPLFRWDVMKRDGYAFWTKRISAMSKLYDVVRIDHFRGFDSYYAIPSGETTAKNGEWKKGPGMDLFRTLEKKLGKLNIIVEDLGFLTPSVLKLVKKSGFPGMKVLQFAFDPREESDYLPHNYKKHSVVYTGTHDNDTTQGWYDSAEEGQKDYFRRLLNVSGNDAVWDMIRQAYSSCAKFAVIPMQDISVSGTQARMNTPGVASGNWQYRCSENDFCSNNASGLRYLSDLFNRH